MHCCDWFMQYCFEKKTSVMLPFQPSNSIIPLLLLTVTAFEEWFMFSYKFCSTSSQWFTLTWQCLSKQTLIRYELLCA